jgi:serine/threonine protein kinase
VIFEKLFFLYCVVFPGELLSGEGFFSVAIKVLKSSASREAEEDFMREVEVMSSFRNEHILTLIGIVLRGKMILQFPFKFFYTYTAFDMYNFPKKTDMYGKKCTCCSNIRILPPLNE